MKKRLQNHEQLSLLPSEASEGLDYKEAYRQIRNYLAGQYVGATRDETLLTEVIKCLFCKLYLIKQQVQFDNNDAFLIAKQYRKAFLELRDLLPNLFGTQAIFSNEEELLLDPASITYIDQKLDKINLDNWSRDPFGDAYEIFIGSTIRGQEGQFFTPQNAVELLVSLVTPKPGERFIDPACGAGGFLNAIARSLVTAGVSPKDVSSSVFGIDKDSYLVNLAAARLSLVTLSPANVFCADSLAWVAEGEKNFVLKNSLGTFDGVVTNPPFGSRIVSVISNVQKVFDLGYKWKTDKKTCKFVRSDILQNSVPPQVLFVERCLSLVKSDGRIGMVVPESLISSKNYRYVINYIREYAYIKAVLGMPESLFKISGKGGTHTKTCLVLFQKKPERELDGGKIRIFMAEAKWCGHDSRGRQLGCDELPEIGRKYHEFLSNMPKKYNHLGYSICDTQIVDNVLAPRYYNPEVNDSLQLLKDTHHLIKFGDLVSSGVITISTGDEVGKLAYGNGDIPFIRTSDISNWEIKVDPKHCISEEIYTAYAKKQDVQEGDILMVRDGTYLIGTCAFITKYDTRIIYQSHLYKLRVNDPSKLSPYLLLAALSSVPVQQQIKSKRFTQDIIDSLGDRIHELILPIPKDKLLQEKVTKMVQQAIHERIEARELTRRACLELLGNSVAKFDFNSN
ncbi:N-6 DNA methylase [Nostoc sp. B(2019)]|nr:N-6 DNA methylase [Nostoc sp. B(2019)]